MPTLRESTSSKAPSIELLLALYVQLCSADMFFQVQKTRNFSMVIYLCTVMSILMPFRAISSSIRKEKIFVLVRVDRMHAL